MAPSKPKKQHKISPDCEILINIPSFSYESYKQCNEAGRNLVFFFIHIVNSHNMLPYQAVPT